GPLVLFGCLLLLGAHYAATDGVLMALASEVVPAPVRGSGLALLTTGTAVARLVAAVGFGALWTWVGLQSASLVFTAGLFLAICLAATVLRPMENKLRYDESAKL